MHLLHPEEHLTCFHYDKTDNPTIKYVEYEHEEREKFKLNRNVLFLILDGGGSISFLGTVNKSMEKGDIFLLPAHSEILGIVKEKTKIIMFYLPVSFSFCDHFSLEMLHKEFNRGKKNTPTIHTLKMNERINSYIDAFLPSWIDGVRCCYYLELKVKELFFLLRAYNKKEDLADFFSPILTSDMDFYNLILNKYSSVKTVKELAYLANYSLTGFEKRFKKVFGISAHKWMKTRLATNLYHEINCTKKTFTEISDIYGFSSSAHFSNFCKSVFGMTPKAIRKGELKFNINDNE